MKLIYIIKEEINKFLKEDVRVISPQNWDVYSKEKPLKIGDKIRVYHGFSKFNDALKVAKYGLSGKERAARAYSYEYVNNPYGLFVTTDFKIARRFGNDVIMEFNVKYNDLDLESPTWKGGGFWGQGQLTGRFNSKKERDYQKLKDRKRARKDKDPRISQSDDPEKAYWLFGSENQALFVGDLNPNMIKYFWVAEKPGYINTRYKKYKPKEFLKKFGKDYEDYDFEARPFKPNDDLDVDKWRDYLKKEYGDDSYIDELFDDFKNYTPDKNIYYIDLLNQLYPKQKKQLQKMFNLPDEVVGLKYFG